ncbi:ABC transporter ATP-binding protein [Natrarchaeobaculum sulfurireducens]|uniref:ABC-type D-xylose/L-arabinose transporter n=1 Tax=Natrarchaeobaculum sulfurireducens TaxID=2044521 RepID=A0A346PB09_9EURY|nr:ABC transporter ATP-binding protein [Natrarchaeobaculum sulfurireducens]AXR76704.1 ABC-type spermidine/putrescine transport system,ATPase component [Natrarchaeobaculum sulfurireducens]AXR80375.1 Glycerol-3-phosphate ABC transporter, ATP-binding protein UgpC [Natrarchaeobaculum sulfurireducens]
MTDITLDNVTKRFEDVTAVDSLGLEIDDGEFLVLVGPSGCGKSTTLRMLAGLESVTEGDILASGEPITDLEPKNRNVAMVFQNYALYPHMSAKRNMTFGMKSAGDYTDDEIEDRVTEAAAILDIEDLLERKPKALSGGERQRVAIGRALVRDPDYLLMDEPLSNLDAKLRIQMRAELSELHDELETTTIYVTHDQTEAMTLGDRVAVMNDGELQQVAKPQELYDYPANRFVAEFIGSPAMNTLPVEIRRDGDGYVAVGDGVDVQLPQTGDLDALEEEQLLLGIRPEDLHEDGANADTSIRATVSVTEPLGDTTLIHGEVAGTLAKFKVSARSSLRQGDTVEFGADLDRLHLFDDETGAAVYHSDRSLETTEQPLSH